MSCSRPCRIALSDSSVKVLPSSKNPLESYFKILLPLVLPHLPPILQRPLRVSRARSLRAEPLLQSLPIQLYNPFSRRTMCIPVVYPKRTYATTSRPAVRVVETHQRYAAPHSRTTVKRSYGTKASTPSVKIRETTTTRRWRR